MGGVGVPQTHHTQKIHRTIGILYGHGELQISQRASTMSMSMLEGRPRTAVVVLNSRLVLPTQQHRRFFSWGRG